MAENLKFLIARCRNAQTRGGADFLRELGERTGLPLAELRLVEPAQAIPLRREIERHVTEGVQSGAVSRQSGLSRDGAAQLMAKLRAALPDDDVYAFPWHSEDFPFATRLHHLLAAWEPLLAFDGDTVSVVTPDLASGLMLDIWSPDAGPAEYTLDTWGAWKP